MRDGYRNKFIYKNDFVKSIANEMGLDYNNISREDAIILHNTCKEKATNDDFVGINLGSDFCAEHEFGISDLRYALGMNDNKIGIKGRTSTLIPDTFRTLTFQYDKKKYIGIIVSSNKYISKYSNSECKMILPNIIDYKSNDLCTAWDSRGFSIVVPIDKKYMIDAIEDAIKNKNLAVFISSSSNPFGHDGLIVAIADRLDKNFVDELENKDKDIIALQKAANKTKIAKKLKRAKKEYYALSPAWITRFDDKIKSKYNVVFWLNPEDQRNYESGWYTVENLLDWTKNKGPIVKNI